MKKQLVAALVLALAAGGVAAGDCDGQKKHDHKHKDPEKRMERLSEKLDLTEAQRVQVREILDAERGKHEALRAETREALAKVLSHEQLKMYDERRRHGMDDKAGVAEGKPAAR